MREKELSMHSKQKGITSQNNFEYKEVVKKSEKPKGQEEMIKRIIQK